MTLKIKNWSNYQHYKTRNPPWIRLHKGIIDDPDWHELDGASAKVLVMLWLIASEDKSMEGGLPCTRKLAFRLRMTEHQINQAISKLSHWLEHDASKALAERLHAAPKSCSEAEAEAEAEAENTLSGKKPDPVPYALIVSRLNEKAGTDFKPSSRATKNMIKARWAEGFRQGDFFTVIDFKVDEWLTDEKMNQYLRPATLFSAKNFESYLQAAKAERPENDKRMRFKP